MENSVQRNTELTGKKPVKKMWLMYGKKFSGSNNSTINEKQKFLLGDPSTSFSDCIVIVLSQSVINNNLVTNL